MVRLKSHEVAARQLVAARETFYQRCHWINIAVAGRTSGASCSIDWSVRTLPSNVTTLNEWFWLPGVLERIAGIGALQLLVSCAPFTSVILQVMCYKFFRRVSTPVYF